MPNILAVNGGSSSIRFAVYATGEPSRRLLGGKLERLGTPDALLKASRTGEAEASIAIEAHSGTSAIEPLLDWLERFAADLTIDAVGHRVVFGMQHSAPELATAELLAELRRMTAYDSV